MDLLSDMAIVAASVAFVAGFLLTAITGSARAVKVFLAILATVFGVGTIAGLIISEGLLVFLLLQIISLMIVLCLVVVLGAACGGGLYMLLHRQPRGIRLSKAELEDYLPAADFATLEGITQDRALGRIKGGYYRGGLHEGSWYIHKAELTQIGVRTHFEN